MNKYLKIIIFIAIAAVIAAGFFFLIKHKGVKATSSSSSANIFPQQVADLIKKAQSLENQGDIIAAKGVYQNILNEYPGIKGFAELQNKVSSLSIKIIFSPTVTPQDSQLYEVTPGDSLQKIAKRFNTTIELIKRANNLSSDVIKPGMKLKVQTQNFSIVVDKSQNTLILLSVEEVIKVYAVSTGKNNSTPTGTFKIINKLIDPPWYSAKGVIPSTSPEYVLGTRWLGIDRPGYGIHGTTDPASIGSQCTEGCVRMRNADVEELYAIVSEGTEVTIVD